MISREDFDRIVGQLSLLGFAEDDIAWSEQIRPPTSAEDFALEAAFVICNSGMKNTIARKIYERCRDAIRNGRSASTVFGHAGKAAAIDAIWRDRDDLFRRFTTAADKVAFCAGLPWIGEITKFHLAKNFGVDCVKPDVHLQRLADHHATTPHDLCAGLSRATGYRVATVDLLLWRACAVGVIDSRSGTIQLGCTANTAPGVADGEAVR